MPIRVTRRVLLAARIWSRFVTVWLTLKRNALPDAVSRLASTAVPSPDRPIPPRRLGTMVFRVLRIGPWRPRCLYQAVVLFTLLRDRGEAVELVIGLPRVAYSKDAHAWVELDGVDVGPPPGQGSHEELVRYA
jgi:hypothetical protein